MKKIYISAYAAEHKKYVDILSEYGKNKKVFSTFFPNEKDFTFLGTSKGKNLIENLKIKLFRDSEIAIFLIGKDSKLRKTIDWELRASMSSFGIFKKCGIIVIYLPEITQEHGEIIPRSLLPEILYKNISNPNCHIIESTWQRINKESGHLEKLLNLSLYYRNTCNYDLNEDIKNNKDTKYNI